MQRIIITGGNRGIGLEFVRQLLARGERVIAACRQPGKALRLTELAGAHPGRLQILPVRLDDERSIRELAREAGLLTEGLDLLINNAGVLVSGERFGELSAATFNDTLAINAVGPLLLTQALAPLLERGTAPRIVNISSDLGSLAATRAFQTPSYGMSKAALNMATRLAAAELGARGMIVISINPGWVKTDMGGAKAPLASAESVTRMLAVIDRLAAADNGRFLDHSGTALDW